MIFSAMLVPACKVVARRIGCVAHPSPDRWHQSPTPLLGGVAIALTVLGGMLVMGGVREVPVLLGAVAAIAIIGLTDDLISLKPATKLIAQIALASAYLFFDYRLHWADSVLLDSLLTVLWIVGITNALNLLDNMDGLCGGVAFIAGAAFLVTHPGEAPGTAAFYEAQYLALMLGAIAGFLIYNFHPASIFMGDTGSLFLGLSLATLTLGHSVGRTGEPSVLSVVAVPVLVLLIPILDTTLVTVSRLLSGRRASAGGKDHSSHRLVAIGLSERRAVTVLCGLAALAGGSAWLVKSLDVSWSILLVVTLLLGMTVFAVFLANVRVYERSEVRALRKKDAVTPLVITFMYKRRVAEVLMDLCLVAIAYYAAYRLRFEGDELQLNLQQFMDSLPIVIATQMVALFAMGAYRGVWRYFSLIDSVQFAKGVLLGTAGAQLAILYLYRYQSYSRTVFFIYAALLFLLLATTRASFRLISEFASRRRQKGERVVIYGAGAGGTIAIRELMSNPDMACRIVGFIDDDPDKQRMRVQGYPVLGALSKLEDMIRRSAVDAVLVSSRTLDPQRLATLNAAAAKHGTRLIRLNLSLEGVDTLRQPLRFPPRADAS